MSGKLPGIIWNPCQLRFNEVVAQEHNGAFHETMTSESFWQIQGDLQLFVGWAWVKTPGFGGHARTLGPFLVLP